jgi:hypothetical protein
LQSEVVKRFERLPDNADDDLKKMQW